MVDVLRVSGESNPKAVAGAIAAVVREQGSAEIQAIGAGAVNQSVKAIAIARGYVAPQGHSLVFQPFFSVIEIDGERRTAIRLVVQQEI